VSDNHEPSASFDPLVQPFVDFWSSYIQQANETTRVMLEGLDENTNVKTWQQRWFEAVSKSMDVYLRSPAFLQTMKQNTDAIVKAKRQADDMAAEFARNANIPTASDISGLFERLHSAEDAILGRLEHIEKRLSAMEKQMGVGEAASS
jgi:hypothetical protein